MTSRLWLILPLASLLVAGMAFVACGDDDDDGGGEEEIAEFEAVVTQLMETDPADEAAVDFFLAHITDDALTYFGYESAEDCAANAEDCIGEPTAVASLADTTIDGDNASTVATGDNGDVLEVHFVREDDTWKLQTFAFTAEIPDGVEAISVEAVDYSFVWDKSDLVSGGLAFALTNEGTEIHELALARVEDGFDIDEVIAAVQSGEFDQEEAPPGVEELVGFAFAAPGATSNLVVEDGLAPGDYAMLCFIPNAEGQAHVVLGMHSEFTVE